MIIFLFLMRQSLCSAILDVTNIEDTVLQRELHSFLKAQGIEVNSPVVNGVTAELRAVHEQAEVGSVEAFYILGLSNLFGWHSLEPDIATAKNWFKLAVDGGHNNSRCIIGLLLSHGNSVTSVNRATAKSLFQLASNDSHSYGHWLLGRSLLEEASVSTASYHTVRDNFVKAAALLMQVAKNDPDTTHSFIPEAAHKLAILYEYGLVQAKAAEGESQSNCNLRKAAELYERASRNGFVESTYHLALMFLEGRGVAQDFVVATSLFQTSAPKHTISMRYLAVIYANGYSHPASIPDYEKALHWYEKCEAREDYPTVQESCAAERNALSSVISHARANSH